MSPLVSPTPFDRSNVAAVIPAYREEKSIFGVATEVRRHLDQVLVVDDGSPDGTEQEARRSGVRVIRHEVNQGKGAAIKTGLRALEAGSVARYILFLDGDGQHLPGEIPRFLAAANEAGPAVILGSRMHDTTTMPPLRRYTNRTMSWLISRVCGQAVPDSQCGFRMVHRDFLPALCTGTDHFDFETESLFRTAEMGGKIASVPITTIYGSEVSKIRPVRDTLRFLSLLWRYRSRLWTADSSSTSR